MLEKLHQITNRISDISDTVTKLLIIPMFFVVVVTFIAQIISRFCFDYSLMWYLDLIRMCYAWALFLAFATTFKAKQHIMLEAVFNQFNDQVKRWCILIGHLLSLAFFILMIVMGTEYTKSATFRALTTIPISRAWKVASVPLAGLLLSIHIIPLILSDIVGFKDNTGDGLTFFGTQD